MPAFPASANNMFILFFASLIGLCALVMILAAVRRLLRPAARGATATMEASGRVATPFKRRDLLTPAERSFFNVLSQASADHHILAKVNLGDLIAPSLPNGSSEWWVAFNSVNQKHVDFVLCDRRTLAPLCAIELDDRSHDRSDRRQRDAGVEAALASAGLPLLRQPVYASYDAPALRARIDAVLAPRRPLD